jgi:hypothetical protein
MVGAGVGTAVGAGVGAGDFRPGARRSKSKTLATPAMSLIRRRLVSRSLVLPTLAIRQRHHQGPAAPVDPDLSSRSVSAGPRRGSSICTINPKASSCCGRGVHCRRRREGRNEVIRHVLYGSFVRLVTLVFVCAATALVRTAAVAKGCPRKGYTRRP